MVGTHTRLSLEHSSANIHPQAKTQALNHKGAVWAVVRLYTRLSKGPAASRKPAPLSALKLKTLVREARHRGYPSVAGGVGSST